MAAPLGNPLVSDYVKKQSRGLATAVQGVGFIIGNVYAFGLLFNFVKDLHPYLSFGIGAINLLFIGIILLILVKDPELDKIHKATFVGSNKQANGKEPLLPEGAEDEEEREESEVLMQRVSVF